MNTDFYTRLDTVQEFSRLTEPGRFVEIPPDWIVVVADVKGSTKAIQEGRYKEVNTIGVSIITGILNKVGRQSIPYVFGGDGATLCIPESMREVVRQTLIGCRRMAKEFFKLDLRIGMVPVRDISVGGHQVLIAKHRVSENYAQAAFTGGGLEYADHCIKDESLQSKYLISESEQDGEADLTGLECRWQNIPSPRGETVSLLVRAMAATRVERAKIYLGVVQEIQRVYGSDDECKPLLPKGLNLTLDGQKLSHESRVRTFGKGGFNAVLYWFSIRLQVLIGMLIMGFGLRFKGVNWGDYKSQTVANSDFRKFDDMLRQILSGTPQMREELEKYLALRHKRRELVYGIFTSKSALMTCMIGDYSGDHVHFVDGDEGGYACAAIQLKKQLKEWDT